MIKLSNNYDLEERTARFGESVIDLCKTVAQDAITKWKESQELTLIIQKITSSLK